MVFISWVIILWLSLLCFSASLFLLLRAHFPPILQDFYDFVPLSCPFFDLTEFSVFSLPLLIPKSLAAPFKRQTCQSQPDCHISEPWAKPNPKSDLKPHFIHWFHAQTGLESFVPSAVPLLFVLFEFHYLWLTYKSIEVPCEIFNLRIILPLINIDNDFVYFQESHRI